MNLANFQNQIIQGDCLDILKTLPDKFVQTCITSPPYYGLRDYGTANWVGGDENCDHIERFSKHAGQRADRDQTSQIFQAKGTCQKCGAIRQDQQIGLEETPEVYVQKLVDVFGKVKRVDPLGITELRIRGMWQIQNPLIVYEDSCEIEDEEKFHLFALMRKDKYDLFSERDRKKLESISNTNFAINDIKIKSPNNPAKLLDAKLIKFSK